MKRINYKKLYKCCFEILVKSGIDNQTADEVASCLIEASLRGIDSHGIRLLPHYVEVIKTGRINKKPKIKFKKSGLTSGVLDADHTFGHAAASLGMKYAIEMANKVGAGFVAIKNSNHFSIAGYYSLQAARADMIGFSTTNTTSIMIPTRGKAPYLGTNPISIAFPIAGEDPVCLDMATTQIAWNKVLRAKDNKEMLDGEWVVDENGSISNDPNKAKGLLPTGLHKGYGLGLVVEVLCAILTGQPAGPYLTPMFTNLSERRHLGHFVGAIKISNFINIKTFKKNVKVLVNELRRIPSIDKKFSVLVAGDPEKNSLAERKKEGIPIDEFVINSLNKLHEELKLSEKLKL